MLLYTLLNFIGAEGLKIVTRVQIRFVSISTVRMIPNGYNVRKSFAVIVSLPKALLMGLETHSFALKHWTKSIFVTVQKWSPGSWQLPRENVSLTTKVALNVPGPFLESKERSGT